jgi:predicted amidohydrolase
MEPRLGEPTADVERSPQRIAAAAADGADAVILPELANTGHVFESRAEAFALAEPIPSGPSVRAWATAAIAHNVHIVVGIA